MKLTESHLRNIIKQELTNILEASLPPVVKGMQVKKTGSTSGVSDPDNPYEPYVTSTTYDIVDKDGNVVGSLNSEDYFGSIHGKLFGKDLPPLSGYGGNTLEPKSGPLSKFHKFAKSKTGNKWLDKNAPK